MPTAKDLMTKDPISLKATSSMKEAFQILQSMEIRHLPVINAQDELIGMISDRDLRSFALPRTLDEAGFGELRSALGGKVADIMTGDVLSVEVEAEATEIIDLMLEHKVGAVPVVDGDGALVGIVSYIDILRELAALVEDAG